MNGQTKYVIHMYKTHIEHKHIHYVIYIHVYREMEIGTDIDI